MWRIATSDMYRDTYADIMDRWTLLDLTHATELLDEMERARILARQRDQG